MDIRLVLLIVFISMLWLYLLMKELDIYIDLKKEKNRISFVKLDKGFIISYVYILLFDAAIFYFDHLVMGEKTMETVICKGWIIILSILFLVSVIFSCIMTVTPGYIVIYGKKIENNSKLHLSIQEVKQGKSRITLLYDHKQYIFEALTGSKTLEMITKFYKVR